MLADTVTLLFFSRHMKHRHLEGEGHPLTLDDILDETKQLDIGNKTRVGMIIDYNCTTGYKDNVMEIIVISGVVGDGGAEGQPKDFGHTRGHLYVQAAIQFDQQAQFAQAAAAVRPKGSGRYLPGRCTGVATQVRQGGQGACRGQPHTRTHQAAG